MLQCTRNDAWFDFLFRSGWQNDATLLSVWRHRQLSLEDGVKLTAYGHLFITHNHMIYRLCLLSINDGRLNVSAMKILLSEGAMTALTRLGGYVIESRGHIDIKVTHFRRWFHCILENYYMYM